MNDNYDDVSREGLVDMLQESTEEIQQLRNFIRTRNAVCTWCGFMVVYDSQDEQAKQSAYTQVNTHALICKKDPRNIDIKAIEANYDALQSSMPCGHLARYAVNVDEGTQYCVMCVCEAVTGTTDKKIQAQIAEIINHE